MPSKVFYQSIPCNGDSLDVKRIMRFQLDEAKRLYGILQKHVAIDLGINEAVLTRWIKEKDGHTIWAHMVIPFCRITRNWTLQRYIAKRGRVA